MMLRRWEDLPDGMRVDAVRPYYDALSKKRFSLLIKRCFDLAAGIVLTAAISPVLLVLAILIKRDSPGPVFFRQVRVTRYGEKFRIFKFRTMVADAEKLGAQVTTSGDMRVTKVGRMLRRMRLDELPQVLNILTGDMSFVGTRPEVEKYVRHYTDEMMATLLLPAGVTSMTSVQYKDEETLLLSAADADQVYINDILPAKMRLNLQAVKNFSLTNDLRAIVWTVRAVLARSDG